MSDPLSIPEKLRANAEIVARTIRDNLNVELSFDEAGVEWIDGYIDRLRGSLPAEQRSGLIEMLAAFVGECMIQTFGGAWAEREGSWGVQVSERIWACPFAKIQKQFENGSEDSVASFFRCTPLLDKHLAEEKSSDPSGASNVVDL
ncbi:MAG TPA: hypothetical protein VGZ47_09750 [Gemmataceae bacterium]|jgi:hypothetical protein|nr:hypothetical protein [Gemmataceae bacterium]